MTIEFRANPSLGDGDINIVVEAKAPTADVLAVMQAVKSVSQRTSPTLSIDTGDRLEIVRKAAILAVEVHGEMLVIRAQNGRALATRDRLYRFMDRLPASQFVQISRQVVINLAHLESLEASYSGNMTACLIGGLKENVSRRYVAGLKEALGA